MAHGVPLATTMDEDNCGAAGAFFLDAGVSSTHHIAGFWRLGVDLAEMPRASAMVSDPYPRAIVTGGETAGGPSDVEEPSFDPEQDPRRRSYDQNHVIATAFKAAGLPVPKLQSGPPGILKHVAPGPTIEAALKAAGLLSSATASAE